MRHRTPNAVRAHGRCITKEAFWIHELHRGRMRRLLGYAIYTGRRNDAKLLGYVIYTGRRTEAKLVRIRDLQRKQEGSKTC